MNKGMKVLAIATLTMAASAMTQSLFANCVNEGPYEVRQCSKGTWFGPKPATAGAHNLQWWAVGFGNGTLASLVTAGEATGNGVGLTPLPGTFIGVDNGSLTAAGLDLVDAEFAGIGAPANTLCFSASANWGSPGMDSCIDINRNDVSGNGSAGASDNIVNKYWDASIAPNPPTGYYEYFNHQLDPPMGVLLTESTGQFFAAAFFASTPKQAPRQSNPDLGQYSMGEITNGDSGPQGSNIVPWQPVPQPSVAAVLSVPTDPLSPRNLTFNWAVPRFIHDNSTRPCIMADMITPCTSLGTATGVGVMDQGSLIHFEVETAPILDTAGTCGTVWTTVAGSRVNAPANTVVVNGVAPDTCARLKTSFGKTPQAAIRTAPATVATRTLNFTDAQRGFYGDIGFTVAGNPTKIGGTLVSQKATLNSASREKGSVHVTFNTDTELNVTGFDVVGIDGKGGRKVLGSVACSQCTTGLGASYDTLVSGAKVQGSKKVQIVMQPSGAISNTLDLK